MNLRPVPLLLLCLASALRAEEPAAPPGFFVALHACPQWAAASGERDYYRVCFDRPFTPGLVDGDSWQLGEMVRNLPNGVLALYLFTTDNPESPAKGAQIFDRYMAAARKVPGAAIVPVVHSIAKDPAQRAKSVEEFLTQLLQSHGDDPAWFRYRGLPLVLDYAHGGLEAPEIKALRERLPRKVTWVTDVGSGLPWVSGEIRPEVAAPLVEAADGGYTFSGPLDRGLGGYAALGKFLGTMSGKVFGAGAGPGSYSSRLSQRNYTSARGTLTLRKRLDAIAAARPDFLEIATWNDYVEDACVEPTYSHTSSYLEIIRRYSDLLSGAPPPDDAQPHVIVSYRKNAFPGEPLSFEVLNLPVRSPFGAMSGRIVLRDEAGNGVAALPFDGLAGDRFEAHDVAWTVPAGRAEGILDVQVELQASGARPFSRIYRGLPPLPLVVHSSMADMLFFSVPLHRLHAGAPPRLRVDGGVGAVSAPLPRALTLVPAQGEEWPIGVSYLKSGAVLNAPTPESAAGPVLDNWDLDPLRRGLVHGDYYGALAAYADGTFAYGSGLWARDETGCRAWADYRFARESDSSLEKNKPDAFLDISGQHHDGVLASANGKGALPQWTPLGLHWDALRFDGAGSVADLPLQACPAGPMTVELLVRPGGAGRRQEIFLQRGASLSLRLEADGRLSVRRLDEDRTFREASSRQPLPPGKWAYVAATYDMSRIRLYVDGALVGDAGAAGLRTAEKVRLGGPLDDGATGAAIDQTAAGDFFKGDLARLRILGGASSPERIAADFAALSPLLAGKGGTGDRP